LHIYGNVLSQNNFCALVKEKSIMKICRVQMEISERCGASLKGIKLISLSFGKWWVNYGKGAKMRFIGVEIAQPMLSLIEIKSF
jgi:hypothetical protein